MQGYMEKALREAKRNTNWMEQNAAWERGVMDFVDAGSTPTPRCAARLDGSSASSSSAATASALGTIALKLTVPGVPDIYQGDELPVFALVDPDNRRPVDWQWNETMLGRLAGGAQPEPAIRKLWLTTRLLGLRIRRPDAFAGAYEPAACAGHGGGVSAWRRGAGGRGDPRRSTQARWTAPTGRWRDVLRATSASSAPRCPWPSCSTSTASRCSSAPERDVTAK